jgi:GNAT superfamily N-acetyltransferase
MTRSPVFLAEGPCGEALAEGPAEHVPEGPAEGLPAGLRVRPARGADRAALEAMFLRCTPETIYRRFHGQVKAFPPGYLTEALASVPSHYALVACCGTRVVALASCRHEPDGTSAELGILIEDAWQRRGLGRSLLALLVAHAESAGVSALDAQMLTEQSWLISLLETYGHCSSAFQPGVREVRLRLARPRPLPRPGGQPQAVTGRHKVW